jgi:hypothetical protein
VLAVVGTLVAIAFLVQLAGQLLADEIGWLTGMLAAGAALLAASLAALRAAHRPSAPPGGADG